MASEKIIYICNSDSNQEFFSDLLGDDYKFVQHYFSVCEASIALEGSKTPLIIMAHEFVEDSIEDFKSDQPDSKTPTLLLCDEFDHEEGLAAVEDKIFFDVIISRPLDEKDKLVNLLKNAVIECKKSENQSNAQSEEKPNDYILAIEDDEFFADIYRESLSELGREIIVAADCMSASNTVFERKPSMIFLDYNLPDFDGLEFLRTIRSEPSLQSIPVVLITGDKNPDLLEQSKLLGVHQFIKKPIKPSEILKLAKALCKDENS